MARVFIVGPHHTPQDRRVLETLASEIQRLGHVPFLPHREAHLATDLTLDETRQTFRLLVKGLEASDAVVAVLDGPDVDAAVGVFLGIAVNLRRPVLGLRSDDRSKSPALGLHPIAFGAAKEYRTVTDWEPATVRQILEPFLASVRVFAGTLVRDAVPKMLEAEGQALKFRTVDPNTYPYVLKRKITETAHRLEEIEWGAEQDEIADLLELLETFINLRQYDRETLRSIKEGKWRKRGGFERGLLLEEEPKLSSG